MKLAALNKKLRSWGEKPLTVADAEVDVTRVMVDRAFNDGDTASGYREKAHGMLLAVGAGFHSDINIQGTILAGLLTVHCPYCTEHSDMELHTSGGNSEISSYEYRCGQGHVVSLRMAHDAVYIGPSS